jgi:periodic tryptophan protein 2
MFIGDCQLHNVVGSFYSSGKVLFHPRRNLLYTPLGSRIKQIDLEHNVTMVLQFECQHNIDHIVIDPNGNTLIAIDSQGFAIVYNLIGDFIIAHFNFKGKVEAACFSPDAKLFAVGI